MVLAVIGVVDYIFVVLTGLVGVTILYAGSAANASVAGGGANW